MKKHYLIVFITTCITGLLLSSCNYSDDQKINVYGYILTNEQFELLTETEKIDFNPVSTNAYASLMPKDDFVNFNEKLSIDDYYYQIDGLPESQIGINWDFTKKFATHNRINCIGGGKISISDNTGIDTLNFEGRLQSKITYFDDKENPIISTNDFEHKDSVKHDEVYVFYQKIEIPELEPHYHTMVISVSSTK